MKEKNGEGEGEEAGPDLHHGEGGVVEGGWRREEIPALGEQTVIKNTK